MVTAAYCGNFDAPHSTENHVALALENLGHSVIRLPEQRMDWASLKSQVGPAALFLWTQTAGFAPADLEEQRRAVKSLDVPSVGIHLDRWWGLSRQTDLWRYPFFQVDFLFTADGDPRNDWASIGANHFWSPPAVLSNEAKRVGVWRKEFDVPVGFVGNLRNYGHPEWGPYRKQLYKFLAMTYKGRFRLWEGGIRGQDLADLYASVKVLVGDSCLAGNPTKYWSDRVPETLGRRGYLIHPYVQGLDMEFPMLPMYPLGDFDALRSLIDVALDHDEDRREVADRAWLHTSNWHLYERRLERVLATVLS